LATAISLKITEEPDNDKVKLRKLELSLDYVFHLFFILSSDVALSPPFITGIWSLKQKRLLD